MRPLIVFSESKAMKKTVLFTNLTSFYGRKGNFVCGSQHNVQKAFLSKPQNIPTMLGV